jgi:hypothetical protein
MDYPWDGGGRRSDRAVNLLDGDAATTGLFVNR